MKKYLIGFLTLLSTLTIQAQLSGIKTIKTTGGDYSSFSAAINDLNLLGVGGGGVTFNVEAGFSISEETPVINPTGSGASNPIVFQKVGIGANPVLRPTGTAATNDWGFRDSTADYLTFDGIDVNINSGSATEYGYYIDGTATNGAQNVTIKNCSITLNKTNTGTKGIYTLSRATGLLGANNNNHFYNNNIQNVYRAMELTGISGFPDLNAEVGTQSGGTSTFSNIGGSTVAIIAVYINNQGNYKAFNLTINNITCSSTAQSSVYCIRQAGTPSYGQIYNNTISSVSNSTTGGVIGISLGGGVAGDQKVYNNTINGLTSTGGSSYGIESGISNATLYIYDNTISGLSSSVNSTLNTVYGITISGASVTNYIYRNKIYNLSNSNSGTQTMVSGMNITGTNANVYNNYIYEINAINSGFTTSPGARGITISGGTSKVKLYHNSVYLSYTSTNPSNTSAALFVGTSYPTFIELRNNIFINNVDVTSGTRAVAHWRGNSTITSYSTETDNNNYFAGTASSKNLLYFDGTTSDQTLTDYRNRFGSREQHSITELSPFINTIAGSTNLHLNTSTPTQCESGGLPVTGILPVSTDYDNDTRGATYVDIGADEGIFTRDDKTGPYISYTALFNTTLTGNRNLTAVIKDPSGVRTSGSGLPVLYWNKNHTAYSPVTAVYAGGDNYQFSFGGGVVLNDSIFYYVVAQDSAASPSVLSNPSTGAGGYSSNPPATSTPTTLPNAYVVTLALPTSINVGTAQTYASLTGAGGVFQAFKNNVITGNVTINVTSDLTEDGTYDFTKWIEEGAGNYTVTIQPSAAAPRLISGNVSSQGMIRFNGCNRVFIEGAVDGIDRFITIRNTGAIYSAVTFGGDASYNTINNCILEAQTQNEQIGVIRFLNGAANGNDNNTISNCLIRDRNDGTAPWSGVVSVSSIGSNSNNKLLNNVISNFTYYGYYGTEGNDNWEMSGNEFTHSAGFTLFSNQVVGISFGATGTNRISNNKIHDLKLAAGGSPINVGIMINNALNLTVEKNRIYNVSGTSGAIYGIYFAGSSASNASATLINNQISLAPSGISNQLLSGIADESFNGNTLTCYYNSVYIGGTNDPASVNHSWAFSRFPVGSGGSVNILRNNIFFNNRSGGTVNNYAIGNGKNTGIANFIISNNFYVGRNGTAPDSYFNNNNAGSQTIAVDFPSWVASYHDIGSYTMRTGTINPDLIFLGKDTANMGINNNNVDSWYINGKGFPIAAVATDYDNNPRSTNVVNGSADIGAFEFSTLRLPPDLTPTGSHTNSGTEDFYFAGRKVASILWGGTGTLPTLDPAKHYTGVWPNDTTNNGTISNARYLNEWWKISATGGSGYTYRLTLYYDSATIGKIQNASTMIMNKKEEAVPGTWLNLIPSIPDLFDRNIYTDGLNSFSEFTASDALAPIPVKLLSFTGIKRNTDVQLNWTVSNETLNTTYLVERSFNGTSFAPVQALNGIAPNGATVSYNITDPGVFVAHTIAYYRLKVTEQGQIRYSNIIILKDDRSGRWMQGVYPNPVKDFTAIALSLSKQSAVSFIISDALGKILYNYTITLNQGTQSIALDMRNYAAGVYLLKVKTGDESEIIKILKN